MWGARRHFWSSECASTAQTVTKMRHEDATCGVRHPRNCRRFWNSGWGAVGWGVGPDILGVCL